jgi:hypothetical protein
MMGGAAASRINAGFFTGQRAHPATAGAASPNAR